MTTMQAIERFLSSPALSEGTRRSYRHDVEEFGRWLQQRDLGVGDVNVRVLTEYAAELGRARTRKLASATIARKIAAIRSFLRFTLGPTNVPDASLAPRRPRRLPDTPKTAEVEAALEALVGDGPLPLRNRALVELVYSAGLRSAEAVGLALDDAAVQPCRRAPPASRLRQGASPLLTCLHPVHRFCVQGGKAVEERPRFRSYAPASRPGKGRRFEARRETVRDGTGCTRSR